MYNVMEQSKLLVTEIDFEIESILVLIITNQLNGDGIIWKVGCSNKII